MQQPALLHKKITKESKTELYTCYTVPDHAELYWIFKSPKIFTNISTKISQTSLVVLQFLSDCNVASNKYI